jgi:Na+/H+ antiporter NhaD/arsenite permease-like protein
LAGEPPAGIRQRLRPGILCQPSAANIVAVGLLAQAGYRISFGRFLRDGLLETVVTLLLATLWLSVRH